MARVFARNLLAWYVERGRSLPWRGQTDPYRVWVSEVMLQQTQVETVIPYYQRWLARFPSLQALAAAPQQDVLAVWEGLGYYSRARNFHRAARLVMDEHAGHMPRTEAGLRALPGIGRYTAAAIASICFGADAAVVDGNVRRVLARVFDIREDVRTPAGERGLWALAARLLPPGQAADYNQALMDLGATICAPRAPACPLCPVRRLCQARRLGVQLERPLMAARPARPRRVMAAAVVRKRGCVLIEQRPDGDLLGGLWAFPAVAVAPADAPTPPPAALRASLRRGLKAHWGLTAEPGVTAHALRHNFTHFQLTLHVFECRWRAGALKRAPDARARRWVRPADLPQYPMGKLDRQIASQLLKAA